MSIPEYKSLEMLGRYDAGGGRQRVLIPYGRPGCPVGSSETVIRRGRALVSENRYSRVVRLPSVDGNDARVTSDVLCVAGKKLCALRAPRFVGRVRMCSILCGCPQFQTLRGDTWVDVTRGVNGWSMSRRYRSACARLRSRLDLLFCNWLRNAESDVAMAALRVLCTESALSAMEGEEARAIRNFRLWCGWPDKDIKKGEISLDALLSAVAAVNPHEAEHLRELTTLELSDFPGVSCLLGGFSVHRKALAAGKLPDVLGAMGLHEGCPEADYRVGDMTRTFPLDSYASPWVQAVEFRVEPRDAQELLAGLR